MKKMLCTIIAVAAIATLHAQDTTSAILTNNDTTTDAFILHRAEYRQFRQSATNITSTLDGSIPGLQSTATNTTPGSSPDLLLRGLSLFGGNSNPLISLNGVPYYGDIAAINVQDIDSISVLRTAMETLPYGSRGANGVISITTKNHNTLRNGRLNVDVRFGLVTRGIPEYDVIRSEKEYLETTYDYLKFLTLNPAGALQTVTGGYNPYNFAYPELFTPDGKIRPDASLLYHDNWDKVVLQTGMKHDYNVSYSGQYKNGGYYFSAGYLNEQGYIKGSRFERFSAVINGEQRLSPWLKAGINTNIATGKDNPIQPGYSGITISRFMAPIYPVYQRDASGQIVTDPATGADQYDWGSSNGKARVFAYNRHPAGELLLDKHDYKHTTAILQPYMEATVLKQLTLKASLQYQLENVDIDNEYNADYGLAQDVNGRINKVDITNRAYTFNQSVTWKPEFQVGHHVALTALHENSGIDNEMSSITITAPGPASVPESSSSMANKYRFESYRALFHYDFKSKYFVHGGFNRDASTYDSPQLRWKNNWAAGAAYLVSQENIFKTSSWLNLLKLRMDYGKQRFLQASPNTPSDQYRLFNAGIDFSGFRNRIHLQADVYRRDHNEVIYVRPTLHGYYAESPMQVRNQGIETSITGVILKGDVCWTATLNLTRNDNKIIHIYANDSVIYTGGQIFKPGNAIGTFFLPEYAGVDPQSGQPLYSVLNSDGTRRNETDYQLANLVENRVISGNANPWAYGSLTQSLTYKNLELSFRLNFGLGGKVYDYVYASLMQNDNGYRGMTWSTDILNHWTPEHTDTDVPILGRNFEGPSTRYLTNASYLSIKNLYLAYRLPETRLAHAKLKSLRIYISAENIWMFSARKGMDPQSNFEGFTGATYSPSRTVMLGLHVGL